MTFLDCSVTNCLYNEDRCCCKGEIKVASREAKHESETCCASFKERREAGTGNTAKRISKVIDVTCEACSCVFNDERKCGAEHIGIAGGNACVCQETECASFRCCG